MGEEEVFFKQTTLPSARESKESNIPIPERIGPYKIESLLAKGGMSLLYIGIDPKNKQKLLVVKTLFPEYVNHPEMVDHFLWEAKIIAMTDHPNIVKLYGQGQWEKGLYIAMEFIQGISLSQFILQQSLSLKRSLEIILQVAYALCHLHSHGVIHRDLKPENILIREDGEIKVVDFGIAQLHEDHFSQKSTIEKKIVGTPSYMSPEQKENPLNISFLSDIYSLGIIAYELLVGKLSYGLIQLNILPLGLQKIIGKALAISPKERYQDVVDFITDISGYLKSPEMEREKPGSDQIKEFLELAQQAQGQLSPSQVPKWREMEIGLSKIRSTGDIGLYYDFYQFANNTYGIIFAETISVGMQSCIHISILRGLIRSLLSEPMQDRSKPINLSKFFQKLNFLICEDRIKMQFAFGFLLLNPFQNMLSFISSGFGSLVHVASGSDHPRLISSPNSYLGIDRSSLFSEATDNWNEGDFLVLHSLILQDKTKEEEMKQIETKLIDFVSKHLLLSPQKAAESMLKKTASISLTSLQRQPKFLLCLQRIS
ncbi:MAG: protein kinase [Chlamydiae bacterium]|nr:protein kinase [Chlamydiota bacterium]